MRVGRWFKWLAYGALSLVGLAATAIAIASILTELDLRQRFPVETVAIDVPTDPGRIAEGARMAHIRGCYNGCHGRAGSGAVMFELPDTTKLVAPDLRTAAHRYTSAEFEALVRQGLKPDGTSVLMVMPSAMFSHLAEDDFANMLAYFQSTEVAPNDLPETRLGPIARSMLQVLQFKFGSFLSAELVRNETPTRIATPPQDPFEHGRYLALTTCTECHGNDLRGGIDGLTPTLAITAAYTLPDFRKLMRSGEPIGARKLELMRTVAIWRFSYFTDLEIEHLWLYLTTLADTAPQGAI